MHTKIKIIRSDYNLKGLYAQFQETYHAKMTMPDLQRYPWKVWLIKYELDINVYNFENWYGMDGMDMEYGMYVDFLKKVTYNYPLLNLK